jgi:hypothetical protein
MRQTIRRLVPQATQLFPSEAPIVSALALRTFPASSASTNQVMISSLRSFRSTSFAASSLADVLKNEIEYEKQNYTQPEVRIFSQNFVEAKKIKVNSFHLYRPPPSFLINQSLNPTSFFLSFSIFKQELAGGPPSPFTLTETRGDTLMSLSRQFGQNETINVDVMVNDQPEEEPFETEEGVLDVDVGVLFTAQVVKGDQSLVFECKSDGSYLSIMHVALEPANGEMEESAYTGPVFDELDDELQRQFQVYLEERGVGPELGGYLLRLVHDKEEREYHFWLEKTAAFLKA